MDFTDIKFPENLEYSSDDFPLPIEFYLEVFPRSVSVELKLGYFSSKAIQVLAYGFSEFIYNGGKIKIITNHFLKTDDRDLVDSNGCLAIDVDGKILNNLNKLRDSLSDTGKHFFDCMKLLVKLGRLEVIPVMLKPGRMAHYKQGLFEDKKGNLLFSDGSCNFTASGLLENGESISVYRSWGEQIEKNKIQSKSENIKRIINKEDESYIYLSKEDILDAIDFIGQDKTIKELFSDGREILERVDGRGKYEAIFDKYKKRLDEKIKKVELEPAFPFDSKPRGYQEEAYKKWIENDCKGIFAMATGTGKTITSLNCVLEQYKEQGYYQVLILVPTAPLLEQWKAEVKSFNFHSIILASSKYNWKRELNELTTSLIFNRKDSFIIISTYKTLCTPAFLDKAKKLPKNTILIADEAHNVGAKQVKSSLLECAFERRIGLSATPKRVYDVEGNALIEEYFNSKEPYTYSFSMERAINEGVLCQYDYYPHIVYLTDDEMEKYAEITKELIKYFDFSTMRYREGTKAETLLLERKRIIHKAANKLGVFRKIAEAIDASIGFSYSFVYAPEGEDDNGNRFIDKYMNVIESVNSGVKAYSYTSKSEDRPQVMAAFENGQIDMIFSMKCLDEGVDIPRAQLAIFCSSTGNPRQFIQRRGRILRRHQDKKYAVIHDLVVFPKASAEGSAFKLERNLVRSELTRVVYFASLARNHYEAMKVLEDIAGQYSLDLFAMESELGVKDE